MRRWGIGRPPARADLWPAAVLACVCLGQEDTDMDGTGDACEASADSTPDQPTQDPPPQQGACATASSGTAAGDELLWTDASELIRGLGGRDRISGLGGDDCLFGNKGSDRIDGGAGADQISGGNKRDRLIGGTGTDAIKAGSGDDRINARDGEADSIRCGKGRDRVVADAADSVSACERVKSR